MAVDIYYRNGKFSNKEFVEKVVAEADKYLIFRENYSGTYRVFKQDLYFRSIRLATNKILYNMIYNNKTGNLTPRGMITLTVDDNHYEDFRKDPGKHLSKFIHRLKKKFPDLEYFTKLERGGYRGRLHYHILINKSLHYTQVMKYWDLGMDKTTTVYCNEEHSDESQVIGGRDFNAVAYLLKYMAKTTSGSKNEEYCKRYLEYNRNLPIVGYTEAIPPKRDKWNGKLIERGRVSRKITARRFTFSKGWEPLPVVKGAKWVPIKEMVKNNKGKYVKHITGIRLKYREDKVIEFTDNAVFYNEIPVKWEYFFHAEYTADEILKMEENKQIEECFGDYNKYRALKKARHYHNWVNKYYLKTFGIPYREFNPINTFRIFKEIYGQKGEFEKP